MARAFLGLGSNLGDRPANLRAALAALGDVVLVSPIYETAPLYVIDQPAFLNMAAAIETDLEPIVLLARVKAIEDDLGRVASIRFGPRLIDIDILLMDACIVAHPELDVPHPRLAERRFALAPLADIAAEILHPRLGLSIGELLRRLPADDTVRRI